MLIDANIFLEVILDQQKSEQSKAFLREVQTGNKKAFISSFSIDSIMLSIFRNHDSLEQAGIFLKSLKYYKGLEVYFPKINDRILCLNLIRDYNLDYDDALTLQVALTLDLKEIVSFDSHFDKIKEIKRVEP